MQKSVLFVCLGNICRSPIAEAVFCHILEQKRLKDAFSCDSAGTSDFNAGRPSDSRALAQLKRKGLSISRCSRPFVKDDVKHFTYILAMDQKNFDDITQIVGFQPPGLSLLRNYDPQGRGEDVPDPFYGAQKEFEEVYDMIFRSLANFLQQITH